MKTTTLASRILRLLPGLARTLAALAAMLFVASAAQAITYDWVGMTNGNLTDTAENWNPAAVPTSTDVAQWSAASYTNAPTANANTNFGELYFTGGNGGVTFGAGASTLTLSGISGVGIQLDSGSGAVNTGGALFALGDNQSWRNHSGNTLTVGGAINLSTYTLTLDGTNTTTLGGAISGAGGLAISAGTVNLNGINLFTNGVLLSGGTLVLGNSKALGAATGVLTITGGTLDSSVASLAMANANPEAWNGDFTFAGTQSLSVGNGAVTLGANCKVTVSAGTLTVGGAIGGG
jgi:hypothetical protein